jgi:hypothetical protein
MTMTWILTFPLWAPLLMLVLYAIGIQYERGGLWSVCMFIAAIGYVFDVFLQYTLAQVYFWEIAPQGEATISARLARLIERKDWRGDVARRLASTLNRLAPSGNHIKVV